MKGATMDTRTEGQCLLLDVILASARVKAHVVTIDERETGIRGLLNYGHSIGHAIEAILAPQVLHGECVAIGMIQEAELSHALGYIDRPSIDRISRCLSSYGLPISLDDERLLCHSNGRACPSSTVMDNMRIDKKNSGSTKKIVLLSNIGATVEQKATAVEDADIQMILEQQQPKTLTLKQSAYQEEHSMTTALREHRSFVSLSFSDYSKVSKETLQAIAKDTSAVEFRVDLLADPNNSDLSPAFVQEQLAHLRSKIGSTPIVYTMRTRSQEGRFPDDQHGKMFELLHLGISNRCEFVDVDMTSSTSYIETLVASKGSSKIIASFHDPQGKYSWTAGMMPFYQRAAQYGDVIKLIGTAKCMQDNIELEAFRARVKDGKPLIAVNMGDKGKLSRVLNEFLTPTTHILLPFVAAPGQLTDQQINHWRKQLCL
jgi:3-dehydroquinate dehydratase type I